MKFTGQNFAVMWTIKSKNGETRTKNTPINEEERPLYIDILEEERRWFMKEGLTRRETRLEPGRNNLGSFIFISKIWSKGKEMN